MKSIFKNNYISIISLLLLSPIIIYFVFFIKVYIAIPAIFVLVICFFKLIKNEKIIKERIIIKKKHYYKKVTIILLLWVLFSGIGSFSYQNSDYSVRNAVFRDLVSYDWPVVFDFSNFNNETLNIIGKEKVGFVYYFTYWLPSALIGKIFGQFVANIFLIFQSLLFLLAIIFLINQFFKKQSYWHVFFLIFFSGLDLLAANEFFQLKELSHIEWWAIHFQYSSNTTLLYWVFNQSIPTWLITILILNMKRPSSILFIAPLIFCFSPFATFGMIPIAIYLILKKILKSKKKLSKLKEIIVSSELLNVIDILIIFGSFYLSADSSISERGLMWQIINIQFDIFLINYFVFISVEVLVYFLILSKKYKKRGLFKIIFIELLLIPFYKMTPANDFCMRASIVPLFILMLYWIKYCNLIKKERLLKKVVIYTIIIISSCTPMIEIGRSVMMTFSEKREHYIQDDIIYSIGNPITKQGILLCNEQFYNKELDNTFYSKYISK